MKPPAKKILLALGVLLLLFVALMALRTPPQEVYRGKTVRAWCQLLLRGSGSGHSAGSAEAQEVLRHFGNQVIPCLAEALTRQPDWRDKVLPYLWSCLPQPLQKRIAPPLTSMQVQENARELVRSLAPETRKAMARQVVPILLARARDPKTAYRESILEGAIRDLEPEPAQLVPDLDRFLKDHDPSMRKAAAFLLMEFGKGALPALTNVMAAVNDSDPEVRLGAVRALMSMGSGAKAAAPVLEQCLADPKLRLDAAFALWTIDRRTNVALAILPEALYDGTGNAAYFLGQIGPGGRAVVPALLKATEQKENNGRFNACEAIWKIDPTQADLITGALVTMLNDPQADEFHLERGARLLGEMGHQAEGLTQVLTDLLKHGNPRVAKAAEEALRQINSAR